MGGFSPGLRRLLEALGVTFVILVGLHATGLRAEPTSVALDPVQDEQQDQAEPIEWPDEEENALSDAEVQVLDVRTPAEFERGHIEGAKNIPLEELRGRLSELPTDRPVWLVCEVGQRAYYANRALLQRGYDVRILSGGMKTRAGFAE